MATSFLASSASSPFPFLSAEQFDQLLANGRMSQAYQARDAFFDPHPIVKLFTPGAHAVWLLTEVDPQATSIAFGLGDLGLGFPEMGCVDLAALQAVCISGRLRIAQDAHFHAAKSLGQYAQDARRAGRIVT